MQEGAQLEDKFEQFQSTLEDKFSKTSSLEIHGKENQNQLHNLLQEIEKLHLENKNCQYKARKNEKRINNTQIHIFERQKEQKELLQKIENVSGEEEALQEQFLGQKNFVLRLIDLYAEMFDCRNLVNIIQENNEEIDKKLNPLQQVIEDAKGILDEF